ncbi:MAG: ribosome silencing factor [Alphaproteobacteria bacterium]|jgi:ribosome-associated protein
METTSRNYKEDEAIAALQSKRPSPKDTLSLIETSLDDDQATDIVIVDLSGKTSIADFMVIATGQSTRQVSAMADHISRKLKETGLRGIATEGQTNNDWVLIDAGDVIVHLFRPEVRDFYNLEKLWSQTTLEANSATIQIA